MRIVVYGGSGTTGRLIARELRRRGADVVLAGRDAARLEAAADALDDARIAVAPVDDPIALATVCEGASVIVGSAGPFGPVGEPLLEAAIASGAHYLDIAGEQAFLRAMYERHEAEARHAGVCAISGLGFEVTLGDLAAGWAAAALAGAAGGDRDRADGGDDAADPVRATDAPTIAVDDPLDEVAVTYALDDFVPTPGTQLSTIASLAEDGVVWQRERWDPVPPAAEQRRINAGPARGGERDAVSFPSGEVITVPRHVAARRIQTYVSPSRSGWAARAARLAAPILTLVGRTGVAAWLARQIDPRPPDDDARARAGFTVIAQARRRFDQTQVAVSGHDVYRVTATIVGWAALALARRDRGPVGVLAPSEAFAPRAALRALAAEADLAVTTSFGTRWP